MKPPLLAPSVALGVVALVGCQQPAVAPTPTPTAVTATPATTSPTRVVESATSTQSRPATTASPSASAAPASSPAAFSLDTARLTTAGYGPFSFGEAWPGSGQMVYQPTAGMECGGWRLTPAPGDRPAFVAFARGGPQDPVQGLQTLDPRVLTKSGVHVGSDRATVTPLTTDVMRTEIQESYFIDGDRFRMTIDVDPQSGKVVVITVAPVSTRKGSFYRMGGACF